MPSGSRTVSTYVTSRGKISCASAEIWKHGHGSVHLCKRNICTALSLRCCLGNSWAGFSRSNKWCPPKRLSRVQVFQQVVSTEESICVWSPSSVCVRFCFTCICVRPAITRFGTQHVGEMNDTLFLFFIKISLPDNPSITLRALQKKQVSPKMINTLSLTTAGLGTVIPTSDVHLPTDASICVIACKCIY